MSHNECQHYIEPVSKRLRKLSEANHSLAEIEALDELLQRLMDLAKEVTAAEASLISLYNPNSRLLEIVSIKDDRFGDQAEELFKGSATLKMGKASPGGSPRTASPSWSRTRKRTRGFPEKRISRGILPPDPSSASLSFIGRNFWVC